MLIACVDKEEISQLKNDLRTAFEVKDLGEAKKILRIKIKRDRNQGTLILSQTGYLKKVLDKFGFENSKPINLPLAPHFKLSVDLCPKTEEEALEMSDVPYSNIVGCLMYLMVCTRPDIASVVSLFSRYMAKPGKAHWQVVKWILRYLKGTMTNGLCYGGAMAANEPSLAELCYALARLD